MSAAKPMTSMRRAGNYLSQTNRRSLTDRQTRRLNHKSRKRLGFTVSISVNPVLTSAPFNRIVDDTRYRARHAFGGPLVDPKAAVVISGTGS